MPTAARPGRIDGRWWRLQSPADSGLRHVGDSTHRGRLKSPLQGVCVLHAHPETNGRVNKTCCAPVRAWGVCWGSDLSEKSLCLGGSSDWVHLCGRMRRVSVNFTLFEKYCFAKIYLSDLYGFCVWYEFCLKRFAVKNHQVVQSLGSAACLAWGGKCCSDPELPMLCELFARDWFAMFYRIQRWRTVVPLV